MTIHQLCDYFDLRACNRAPAVPLLPAPRQYTHPTITILHAYERDLTPGDVLAGAGGRRYAVCTITQQKHALYGHTYAVTGQWIDSGEMVTVTLFPGNGKQTVYGGPKFAAALADPTLVWKNSADKWHWQDAPMGRAG